MRRTLLVALAVVVLVVTAGCTTPSGTANVYVSDQPTAIDDFRHLNVSITTVGAYNAESSKWETRTVSRSVDLARLQGTNATLVDALELPAGNYTKVYLEMDNVDGVLTNGTEASVELQSDQIEVSTPFTVTPNGNTTYVFDLVVVSNVDGAYVIRPNDADSGPNQPVDPV